MYINEMELNFRNFNLASALSLVVCELIWLPFSDGYASGAGNGACTTLKPGHGSASGSPSPYTIRVPNGATTYTPGTPISGMYVILVSSVAFRKKDCDERPGLHEISKWSKSENIGLTIPGNYLSKSGGFTPEIRTKSAGFHGM